MYTLSFLTPRPLHHGAFPSVFQIPHQLQELTGGVSWRPYLLHRAHGGPLHPSHLLGMCDEPFCLFHQRIYLARSEYQAVLAVLHQEGDTADGIAAHQHTTLAHGLVSHGSPALIAVGGEEEDVVLAHGLQHLLVGYGTEEVDAVL